MTFFDHGIEFEDEDAEFFPNGRARDATLTKDTEIQGVQCAGGQSVVFYESGRIKLAWLAKTAVLDSIPCCAGDIVFFHENGRLMNATLERDHDFSGLRIHAGARVTLDESGRLFEFRETLSKDESIDDVACSASFGIWRYPSGKPSVVVVASPTVLKGRRYAAGTMLTLDENGDVLEAVTLDLDMSRECRRPVCGRYQTTWE